MYLDAFGASVICICHVPAGGTAAMLPLWGMHTCAEPAWNHWHAHMTYVM